MYDENAFRWKIYNNQLMWTKTEEEEAKRVKEEELIVCCFPGYDLDIAKTTISSSSLVSQMNHFISRR